MKTLEEMSYLHIIKQLEEEVRKLTDENKLLCESIKRYFNEKEDKEPPCCGNCISFTDEDAFGEGLCCDKEGGTVCWEWCNKHKYR